MSDPINTIKNAVNTELAGYIQTALTPYVAQQAGTLVGEGSTSVPWTVEETANNTYTYQPKQKETVPGYRKKDGTYVDKYERQATPITVALDDDIGGLDVAIEQGIGMLIADLQSRI